MDYNSFVRENAKLKTFPFTNHILTKIFFNTSQVFKTST